MGFRSMVFARNSIGELSGEVNTIIGNASGYIADKQALADFVGVPIGQVSGFVVDGTDVKARIHQNYSLIPQALLAIPTLTFYDDIEGRCLALGTQEDGRFTMPSNIRFLNFPNAQGLYVQTQWSMTGSRTMLTHLNYKNMTNFGGTTGKNYMFSALISRPSLIVHPSVVDDGDFTHAKNSLGFRTVIASGTPNTPSDIIDLSLDNSYAYALKIQHSAITTSIPIESYFVYVNGVYNQCVRIEEGSYILGLQPQTTYTIKVIAIDDEFNRSGFSNSVTVTTPANTYSGTYSAEYTAMLDYAVANNLQVPSVAQRAIDNQRILNLKSAGIWGLLDLFYYFNNDYPPIEMTRNFYIINWKNPSLFYLRNYDIAEKHLSYKRNKGFYNSSAIARWAHTEFKPATDSTQMSKSSTCLGWKLIDKSETVNQAAFIFGGRAAQTTEQVFVQHTGTILYTRLFGIEGNSTVQYADSNKPFMFNDFGSAKYSYMDGVIHSANNSGNLLDGGMETLPMCLFASSTNSSGGANYQFALDLGIQWLHFGASLEGKVVDMNNILKNTY